MWRDKQLTLHYGFLSCTTLPLGVCFERINPQSLLDFDSAPERTPMVKRPGRSPLLLPELFHYILDYLDVPTPVTQIEQHVTGIKVREPSPAARQAFLALAQTCRALSGPSLDRLWQSLGSLRPLIRCFAGVVDTERIVVSALHPLFERLS